MSESKRAGGREASFRMDQGVREQPPAGGDLSQISKSTALVESFERAHRLALDQGHGVVTLEHLLFALTDDPEAAGVLMSSDVPIDRLRADVSSYLGSLTGSLPPVTGPSALPGKDLLRILQLAGTAARQSPRKLVDGAIVVAAVVGEANSPSAGLLKAHGLTFEAVIRALQRASATPAGGGLPAPVAAAQIPPPAPVPMRPVVPPQTPGVLAATEEMLASVRARVKQAEPPPIGVRLAPPTRPVTTGSAPVPLEVPAPTPTPPVEPAAGSPAPGPVPSPQPPQPPQPPPVARAVPPPVAPAAAVGTTAKSGVPNPAEMSAFDALRLASTEAPVRAVPPPLPPSRMPSPPAAPAPVAGPVQAPPPPPAPHAAAQLYAPPPPTLQPFDIMAAARGIVGVMPANVPTPVEIRIPREQIDILRTAAGWQPPRGAPPNAAGSMVRPDTALTRAVGVQLTSEPADALLVTALTPETVWFDRPILAPGEMCVWRFTVTPQRSGRYGLTLAVLGRTIGPAGVAVDQAAASETFEINVRASKRATAIRLVGYLVAFAAGAITASFAHSGVVSMLGTWVKTVLR
jgi:hypothetical protein